jgi:hypothetical protein
VISVGASTDHDEIAGFSNWGPTTVDIAAPGQNIFSTWKGGTYQLDSGTSMATPHVSGAAALLLAKYPNLSYLQIKTRLLANVDHPLQLAGFVRSGRLNVAASLVEDDTPPGSPSGFTALQASSDAMLLNWTASGDDGATGAASQYELRFSTGPINEANLQFAGLAPQLPAPAPSGEQQSYLLPGLSAGIPFYLALRSMDKVGNYSPLVTLGPITTASPSSPLIQVSDNAEGAPLFFGWTATGEAFASASHSYTDSPGGSYLPNTDSSLTLNSPVSLVGFAPRLQFKTKYDLENGFDFLYVEVSADQGQTWQRTPLSLTGTVSSFVAQSVSLAPYYGQSVLVRFRLLTDGIGQQNGAWIDDIQILGNQLFNLNGPQVPLAPSNMAAHATSQTSVHLTWTDNSSDETHFRVERRVGLSGGNWVVVGSPVADAAQMDDATATAGTTYTYRMFAVNAEGDSPAAAVQVSTPPFPPAVPANPEATDGPGSITLLWQGSPGATSYTVRRSLAPGGPHTTLKSGVSLTAYVDTDVTFGTTYYYTISAVNSGGESAESAEVSGAPLPAPPAPPTNVKAKRPTAKKSVVTWTQSAGPDVAKNRIYRAIAQSGPWTLVAEINPGKSYTNTGLVKRTAYYYQVTAVSSLGAESTRSNTALVKKK